MTDDRDRDELLLGELDLEAWPVQVPPPQFAERVLAEVSAETSSSRREPLSPPRAPRRWAPIAGIVTVLAAAAAIGALYIGAPPGRGEAMVAVRTELPLGRRALAVLEAGAKVRWDGDRVEQDRGDVFYRVEPGARFTVHTPAGDVEVHGTCFAIRLSETFEEKSAMQKRDVKSAAIGAVISVAAMVVVYEGKVTVSNAGQRVDLRAGEAAQTSANGVVRSAASDPEGKGDTPSVEESDDPNVRANRNLVQQVGEYRTRLEAIARQKSELEVKLKKSEESLAVHNGQPPSKHDFDLSGDDWKDLAKDGTIKYQIPCVDPKGGGWTPSPEKLNALGLAPQDGATLNAAYKRSSERIWSAIKPLCAAAVGSADVASRIGPETCIHLVLDLETERDPEGAKRARREVGEIRAGVRPVPGPNENLNPVTKLFLTTTGSSRALEEDLAQSFGPDEAHRLVYSDDLCMGRSIFGGSPKRKL